MTPADNSATLLEKLSLLTRLQGEPLSAHALTAQTLRNAEGRVDLNSLGQVLLSHGYENQLSQRPLLEVPALVNRPGFRGGWLV